MDKILDAIKREAVQAAKIWAPFSSLHEAYAVLLEEVEELWDEVKRSQKDPDRIPYVKKEAIQVAAMAMRMIYDCCDKNE